LLPETRKAIKKAIAEIEASNVRLKPEAVGLVFRTCHGKRWVDDQNSRNAITNEFAKLMQAAGIDKPGVNFYGLRHTFRTIADQTRDEPAINLIMGHADDSMPANYRQRIDDDRIKAVCQHVRKWLGRIG
jgi:integrase